MKTGKFNKNSDNLLYLLCFYNIRCKEWIDASGRSDLKHKTPQNLYNDYKICAEHFIDEHFWRKEKNKLLPCAVPIYCNLLSQRMLFNAIFLKTECFIIVLTL